MKKINKLIKPETISSKEIKRINNSLPFFIQTSTKNSYSNINSLNLINSKFNHLVVFCGKGLDSQICHSINLLAKINKSLTIAVTNRKEPEIKILNKNVLIIDLYIEEENIPKGISSENFLICELKSISKFLKKSNLQFEYFTRIRKDIFLNTMTFLQYLQMVPSLTKKYPIILSEHSTNLLKRFCLSDHFFTMPAYMIIDLNLRYRINPKKNLFWWEYRHIKPFEILSNSHQMEQWLWSHFLSSSQININLNCSYEEYINYLYKYFLVIPTKQIGYLWTRSSEFYLNNWVRFASVGHDLSRTTIPPRVWISYTSFLGLYFKDKNVLTYFIAVRKIIFFRKLIRLFFTLPLYYLKYCYQILKRNI